MKALKNLGLAVLLMAATSCGNGNETHSETETQTSANVKDTINAYVCPMRCENSGGSQTGACPVCGMDLVQNKDFLGNNLSNAEGEISDSSNSTEKKADSTMVKIQ